MKLVLLENSLGELKIFPFPSIFIFLFKINFIEHIQQIGR